MQLPLDKPTKVKSATTIADITRKLISTDKQEHVIIYCLDVSLKIKRIEVVSIGTLNMTVAHPRDIFRVAIEASAASIIMVHNHPSNESNPSGADDSTTIKIKKAGELLGIKLIDHIIVTKDSHYSYKEEDCL